MCLTLSFLPSFFHQEEERGREEGRGGGLDFSLSTFSFLDTLSFLLTGQGVALDGLPSVETRRRMGALLEVGKRGRERGRKGGREGGKGKTAHFSLLPDTTVTRLAFRAAGSFRLDHLLPVRGAGMLCLPSLPPSLPLLS